jgi:neopullulanase
LHHEYGRVARLDGAQLAARLTDILGAYAPETTAVQLNLLDSHDTPRALSVLGNDREALELAVLLQATLPGAPCIYYGDEVGVEGGIDPDSRRAFPWDAGRWDGALLAAVREAFALRRAEPALRSDGVEVTVTLGDAIVFCRRDDSGEFAVALNANDDPVGVPLDKAGGASSSSGSVVLAMGRARTTPPRLDESEGRPTLHLPGRSGAVVRRA